MSFNGILLETSQDRATRQLKGFYGVQVEFDGFPIRVTDRKGRGLANVRLVASNPGGTEREAFTDSTGNAIIVLNSANPNPILVEKEKVFLTVNKTTETQLTIVLEPPIFE